MARWMISFSQTIVTLFLALISNSLIKPIDCLPRSPLQENSNSPTITASASSPTSTPFVNKCDISYGDSAVPIYNCNQVSAKAIDSLIQTQTSLNESPTPFQIQFTCTASSILCTKAKNGFQRAFQSISSALKIYTPIIVGAKFISFCNSSLSSSCESTKNTLGQASATSYYTAIDDNGNSVLYPQALIKQMSMDALPTYSSTDITAQFNADADFWFTGDGPMSSTQYHFEYVITHELIHGMGFATSWRNYFNSEYLTPMPKTIIQKGTNSNNNEIQIQGWMSPFIFDTFLIDSKTKTSLMIASQAITSITPPSTTNSMTFSSFQSLLESSSTALSAAKTIYRLATTPDESISFQIPPFELGSNKNALVPLETSLSPYIPGSSICHLSNSLTNTADFLMRAKLENGISLSDLMKNNNQQYGVLGPRLIAILQAMGWPTEANPNQIVRVFDTKNSAQSHHQFLGILLGMIFPILTTLFSMIFL